MPRESLLKLLGTLFSESHAFSFAIAEHRTATLS